MEVKVPGTDNFFDHDADIGIIGHGETIEDCFADTARVMFSLMLDIKEVHLLNIIHFEFEEEDVDLALITWLNLLIAKSEEHHLDFGDFRLVHEGKIWKATVSGEPTRASLERGVAIKAATANMLSVKKVDHTWEARCVVDV